MNTNNRIVATIFPRDIVCLRNISIIPCIKEMMMMIIVIIIIIIIMSTAQYTTALPGIRSFRLFCL